jgi:hypothetical protein
VINSVKIRVISGMSYPPCTLKSVNLFREGEGASVVSGRTASAEMTLSSSCARTYEDSQWISLCY